MDSGNFLLLQTITEDEWHLITINYKGPDMTSGGLDYYRNGGNKVTFTHATQGTSVTNDGQVVVGRLTVDGDTQDEYSSMEFDELVFYNEVLTEPKILSLYQAVYP